MTKAEAKGRIEALKKEIDHHRYLYHVLDQQEISDAAIDSLKSELQQLEQEYPEFVTLDSPTQRVGGAPLPEFSQIRHTKRMLSLNDFFSREELEQWERRNKKIIPVDYSYFTELKIDGVALSLVYEDGVLLHAVTRGDGTVGEDVTQNIKTIEAVPLMLRKNIPGKVEVRGEAYIPKKDFDAMNKEREKEGLPLFANPRNIASGSIRQLDPAITASRNLRFFAWEITDGIDVHTRTEEYETLQSLGFPVPPGGLYCKDLLAVGKVISKEEKQRTRHFFQVDGLVVKVDDLSVSRRLGIVGKAPRGSAAYKFPAEEATTIVEDIVVQVGRTGALTPVAHLAPVRVAGTTVSRATLHNAEEIERKDVRVGDTVIVRKAGDIIPEVVSVLMGLRNKESKPFSMPRTCPVCKASVHKDLDGVVIRCTNANCFSQQREKIIYAVGRAGFDIEGIGEKTIEQLLQEGLIKNPIDLWELKEGDLLPLEGFAEKSAQKVIQEIQAKKEIPLPRFLVALGIPHVGVVTAQDLARHYGTIDALLRASAEELESLEGVGQKIARAIAEFFSREDVRAMIQKYSDMGIVILKEKPAGHLAGKTFVFTGTFSGMTREEAKQNVQSLGGRIASTVGKQVDYVVIGEDAGSKAAKAEALGIPRITEKEFASLLVKPV